MAAEQTVVEEVKQKAEAAVRSPWVERVSRFGYASKGVVYLLVGILGMQVALGYRRAAPDTQDALVTIVSRPFGTVLLGLVTLGLFAYAVWRLVQALLDPEEKGTSLGGLAQRAGYVMSGLAYGGVGMAAIEIISRPWGGSQESNNTEDWTATFLALPFGPWLVALAGLVMLGYGLEQLYESLSGSFRERLKMHEMGDDIATWIVAFGRFGYGARAVVYSLVGIFLIRAAYLVNAEEADGLREVLETLLVRPYGQWILGAVSLGIFCYGMFSLMEARYRDINT